MCGWSRCREVERTKIYPKISGKLKYLFIRSVGTLSTSSAVIVCSVIWSIGLEVASWTVSRHYLYDILVNCMQWCKLGKRVIVGIDKQ